uniref:Uncharacterized protein n=1 Tax=Stomoxys calcitrans TaxID=35570 RepID=A0A1I8PSR5_STOCA
MVYSLNCLDWSLLATDCSCATRFRRCSFRRHTLPHGAPQLEDAPLNIAISITAPSFAWDLVLTSTAMIRVAGDEVDNWASMRALICQSLTMSRIAYSTFRHLGLGSFLHQGQRFASLKIMPRDTGNTWELKVNAHITYELRLRPYSGPLFEDPTRDFSDNSLADPHLRSNVPIDLELRADTYSALHREGCLHTGVGDLKVYA